MAPAQGLHQARHQLPEGTPRRPARPRPDPRAGLARPVGRTVPGTVRAPEDLKILVRTSHRGCLPQVQRLAGPTPGWLAAVRVRAAGQHAVELTTGADAELGEDLAQVVLDGVGADEQPGADLRVGQAVAGQL